MYTLLFDADLGNKHKVLRSLRNLIPLYLLARLCG